MDQSSNNGIYLRKWTVIVALLAALACVPSAVIDLYNFLLPKVESVDIVAHFDASVFSLPPQFSTELKELKKAVESDQNAINKINNLEKIANLQHMLAIQIFNNGQIPATDSFAQFPQPAIGYVADDTKKVIFTYDTPTTKFDFGKIRNGESIIVYCYFTDPLPNEAYISLSYTGGGRSYQIKNPELDNRLYALAFYDLALFFCGAFVPVLGALLTNMTKSWWQKERAPI